MGVPGEVSGNIWDRWHVEGPDPEVGIFGDLWSHEECSREYDQGVEVSEHLHGYATNGYVDNTVTLHCLDCGATESFEDAVFVGYEEDNFQQELDWWKIDSISGA